MTRASPGRRSFQDDADATASITICRTRIHVAAATNWNTGKSWTEP